MTYAITLVKGNPKERGTTHLILESLAKDPAFKKKTGVEIQEVFISFGWPDFVLLLQGDNVELLKNGIIALRDEVAKKGDEIETSTIICTKQDEINRKNKEWSKLTG